MIKVPVYVVPGSNANRAIIFMNKDKAKRAMWTSASEPKMEWLVYDELNNDIAEISFAYKVYNGEYSDWYLTEYEAIRSCSGKMPWFFYEAIVK